MNKELLLKRIQDLTHPLSPVPAKHDTKLNELSNIRCVAFDFYGTMFMSGVGDIGVDEDQQANSNTYFAESIRNAGFEIVEDNAAQRGQNLFEETITNYITAANNDGITHPEPDLRAVWWDVLIKLLDEGYINGNLTKDSAIRFGIEFEFRINSIWPVPNLKSLLTSLIQEDITLGIISNSQYYTPLAFESFYGETPEDFGFNSNLLIWSYQKRLKKPSINFYRQFIKAAKDENLHPDEILYVGNDIRKDIEPAKNLGLQTALYVGDQRSIRHKAEDLKKEEYKPDIIIDDLTEITQCLSFD